MNQPIFHVASPEDAALASDNRAYHTASLEAEGFIHCCTAEQLPGVLQRYYADIKEVVLLSLNSEALTSELVMENTVGGTELFPHVYGKINSEAILQAKPLGRAAMDAVAQSDVYHP